MYPFSYHHTIVQPPHLRQAEDSLVQRRLQQDCLVLRRQQHVSMSLSHNNVTYLVYIHFSNFCFFFYLPICSSAAGGLFGATAAPKPAASGGLFGSTPAAARKATSMQYFVYQIHHPSNFLLFSPFQRLVAYLVQIQHLLQVRTIYGFVCNIVLSIIVLLTMLSIFLPSSGCWRSIWVDCTR